MAGKAQFQKTSLDLTNKNIISSKVLFGVSRQNSSGLANVGGVTGSGQGQSIAPDGTGLLKTAGGSMIGPISYYPIAKNLSYSAGIGHLDVSSTTGAYTSFVLLGAVGSLEWYWIDGDSFDGQQLKVMIPATTTVHIHNGDNVTTGNISTKTGSTVDVTGICMLTFTFSSFQNGWVMEAGQGDIYANTTLSNLTSPTTVNQSLIPLTNNNLNLGKLTSIWDVLYINDVHFTDITDPNDKFTDIAYNPSTHDLEYSQTISGITAGQVFIYNTNKILGITGDNTYGDVGYVEFHQIHAYTTASAGTAPPLPSNPFGYIIIKRNGSQYKIPIYGI